MKNKKENTKNIKGLIPRIAKKIGENSVDAACGWWICQPKVPDCMKKENKVN